MARGHQDHHNTKLINTLLGFANSTLDCHHTHNLLERSELVKFQCVLGMADGRCVAAAVFRSVPPTSRKAGWADLLLLAVRREEERRGYGSAMVAQVKRLCEAAAATTLLVSRCRRQCQL